jgi:hypothetical protein
MTNLWWGRMLLARGGAGDSERAGRLLDKALMAGKEHNYTLVERRATAARQP